MIKWPFSSRTTPDAHARAKMSEGDTTRGVNILFFIVDFLDVMRYRRV
jgi:hypothetical protein